MGGACGRNMEEVNLGYYSAKYVCTYIYIQSETQLTDGITT